jgi:hypothetical protein
MDRPPILIHYIHRLVSDSRLKPAHLLLSIAICDKWASCEFTRAYQVSRGALMKASRIKSTATYHKAIRELQKFGYVRYYPSYHPTKGSRIEMICETRTDNYAEQ